MTKYHAKRTEVDGVVFASKREAARYAELKILERIGKIAKLKLQPRYPIVIRNVKVCDYVADFSYMNLNEDRSEAWLVVEDVKGVRTPVYQLKKKLFEAAYAPLRIVEVE